MYYVIYYFIQDTVIYAVIANSGSHTIRICSQWANAVNGPMQSILFHVIFILRAK